MTIYLKPNGNTTSHSPCRVETKGDLTAIYSYDMIVGFQSDTMGYVRKKWRIGNERGNTESAISSHITMAENFLVERTHLVKHSIEKDEFWKLMADHGILQVFAYTGAEFDSKPVENICPGRSGLCKFR